MLDAYPYFVSRNQSYGCNADVVFGCEVFSHHPRRQFQPNKANLIYRQLCTSVQLALRVMASIFCSLVSHVLKVGSKEQVTRTDTKRGIAGMANARSVGGRLSICNLPRKSVRQNFMHFVEKPLTPVAGAIPSSRPYPTRISLLDVGPKIPNRVFPWNRPASDQRVAIFIESLTVHGAVAIRIVLSTATFDGTNFHGMIGCRHVRSPRQNEYCLELRRGATRRGSLYFTNKNEQFNSGAALCAA